MFTSSNHRQVACFIVVAASALALPGRAQADRRGFGYTYEYPTLAEGAVELEFWNTQSGGFADADPSSLDLEIEVEYGITSHWEVALYQTLIQAAVDAPLTYGKTKLETRYRLAERGQWPIDINLYLEVAKPFGKEEVEVEPKLILARDFGPLTVVANLIGEVEIEDGAEFIPGFTFGATYEVSPALKIGAEIFGELEEEIDAVTGEEERELEMAAGPAIGWAPTPNLWVASTLAAGLTHAPDLQWRVILGLGF